MIILKPERPKKKPKNWRKIKRRLPLLAGLFIFAVLFYSLFFSGYFVIENIVIDGNKNIPTDKLNDEIEQWMERSYLLIFPVNNLFVFPIDRFEKHLEEKFTRIESAKIDKRLPGTLRISISENRGAFKWCRLDGCFLINEQGFAYNVPLDDSSLTGEEKSLIVIKEPVNGLPSDNDKIISDTIIKTIWKINDNLGPEISEFTIPSVFSNRIVVIMKDGWQLIFSGSLPVEDQLRNYKVLFPEQISNEQKKDLEYIDLTVGGRAYYKIKN